MLGSWLVRISHYLATLGCTVIFITQLCFLIQEYLDPTELNMTMKRVNLGDLKEFPLVFKFCIRPGLNMTELNMEGYTNIDNYFWGLLSQEDYDVGWDGKNSSLSPAGDYFLKCSLPSPFHILWSIFLFPRIAGKESCGEIA